LESLPTNFAQGPIFTDTVWNKAGNPYELTGDVQVPSNVQLNITEGTTVIFGGDFQILIKGQLRIVGTPGKRVQFLGSNSRKAMIIFMSTDLSASSIACVDFRGPQAAIQLFIQVANPS
jgi:hypothetical protein